MCVSEGRRGVCFSRHGGEDTDDVFFRREVRFLSIYLSFSLPKLAHMGYLKVNINMVETLQVCRAHQYPWID